MNKFTISPFKYDKFNVLKNILNIRIMNTNINDKMNKLSSDILNGTKLLYIYFQ